jgi:hypothetical protein
MYNYPPYPRPGPNGPDKVLCAESLEDPNDLNKKTTCFVGIITDTPWLEGLLFIMLAVFISRIILELMLSSQGSF